RDTGHTGKSAEFLLERVYKLEAFGILVFNCRQIQAEADNTCRIKAGVDLLQLPEGANHQARADDEDHCERNLCDYESLAERLTSSSNRALPCPANPVSQVAFTDLGQWCESKEKDSNDCNRDGKREYGKTNTNLVSTRHAVRSKQ